MNAIVAAKAPPPVQGKVHAPAMLAAFDGWASRQCAPRRGAGARAATIAWMTCATGMSSATQMVRLHDVFSA